jgi:hypothetical protein
VSRIRQPIVLAGALAVASAIVVPAIAAGWATSPTGDGKKATIVGTAGDDHLSGTKAAASSAALGTTS